tara:strand:- start:197 stop:391 length:195 start_codon:yes stop_codon:yes gene_type:complete
MITPMSTITTLGQVNTMIKRLKKALKASMDDPFLYTEEEVIYMKRNLSNLYTERRELNRGNGFG